MPQLPQHRSYFIVARGHDDAPRALLGVDAAQQRGVPRLVLARRLVEVRVRRRGVAAGGHVVAAAHGRGHGGAVGGGHWLPGNWLKVRVARPAPAQRTAGSFVDPMPAYALQGGALRLAGFVFW